MNNDSVGFPLLSPVVRVMIVLIFCLGATGCSTLKSITSNKDSKQLFKSRDQFVRIVKQDSVKGQKVPANGQPVSLDEGQVRMALRSLEFMTPGKDSSSPVFGDGELDILARYLPQALAQAGPEEDVTLPSLVTTKRFMGLQKSKCSPLAGYFIVTGN